MERTATAEPIAIKEKILPTDLAVVSLVLLHLAIMLLDLYSHPHQGLADQERRQLLIQVIGPIAKNIGNYAFSAAPAMAAVFLKHGIDQVSDNELVRKISRNAFKIFIASLITLNAVIEHFPNNNELAGDLLTGIIGVAMGVTITEIAIKKISKNKQLL